MDLVLHYKMSLGGNTANFRWFYMLDDLIDIETDQEKAQQLKNCQVSLQKYPLVVHKPDELRVLKHFKDDIVDKLQARFAQEQSFFVQKAFSQVEDPDSKDPKQSLGDISGSGSGNGQKPARVLSRNIILSEGDKSTPHPWKIGARFQNFNFQRIKHFFPSIQPIYLIKSPQVLTLKFDLKIKFCGINLFGKKSTFS